MLNDIVQIPPMGMLVMFNLRRKRSDDGSCTWTKVRSMRENRVRHQSDVSKATQVMNQSLYSIMPCSEVRLTIQNTNMCGRRQGTNGRTRRRRINWWWMWNMIIWMGIIWIMRSAPHRNSVSGKLTRCVGMMINIWWWRNMLWKLLWEVKRSWNERL